MATRSSSKRKPHHNVYVIELALEVREYRRFRKAYPDVDPNAICLYVGRTGLLPEVRFVRHKLGIQKSLLVQKFGVRLRPDLYEGLNPMSWEEAVEAEPRLAGELRDKGFVVWSH